MTATLSPETIDLAAHRHRAWTVARAAILSRLRLPPKLSGSEWADRYRILSPEASAEPGPWRTDRVPYLREPMDVTCGRDHQEVVLVKCSQSGGTEVINNAVGFFIDQEPSPMLTIQPNVKPMAEAWSKERLAPMLRDTPRLRGKVREAKSRDSGNTIQSKAFPGGHLAVMGANSPAGLASRPIRCVFADELDRWPASAGTEGDPLALAEARQITFRHRRKLVMVSSPGNEGESRIEKAWKLSDQRHFYVPCPHCGEQQPLEWRDTGGRPGVTAGKGAYRLVWDKTITEDGEEVHHPETAGYECRACGQKAYEQHKAAMLAAGVWVKHNPSSDRAGFHVPGLLSPWIRWVDLAKKWLTVKDDPEQRKTFFNTLLGLLYTESGEVPDAEGLEGRREVFHAEVPPGVVALTMAVDVQGDRLEAEVRGWGRLEESWAVRVERILGDPTDFAEVWGVVDELRQKAWSRADGSTLRVAAVMVDSSYLTDVVYRWVRPRQRQRVFAYKGADNAVTPISRASKANADGVKVVTVNPTKFKDVLFRRLKRAVPGAGYLHIGQPETGVDRPYLQQYGAEKRVVEFKANVPKVSYVKIAPRNEAIDLYVMNVAALRMLPRTWRESRGIAPGREAPKQEAPPAPELAPEPPVVERMRPKPFPAPRRAGWVGKW